MQQEGPALHAGEAPFEAQGGGQGVQADVVNIQVIRVKIRVPAEKVRDQQAGEVHGEGQRRQPAEEVTP